MWHHVESSVVSEDKSLMTKQYDVHSINDKADVIYHHTFIQGCSHDQSSIIYSYTEDREGIVITF